MIYFNILLLNTSNFEPFKPTLGTLLLAKGLTESGNEVENGLFFDTIRVQPRLDMYEIKHRAKEMMINLRYFPDDSVGISLDETTTRRDIEDLLWVFACPKTLSQVTFNIYAHLFNLT